MFIHLTMIRSDRTRDRRFSEPENIYTDTDEPDENPVPQEPALVTTPVSVNVACIRCYYPRREERPGTRITFSDGGGYAVAESYEEVSRLILTATGAVGFHA